ncbi:MAG: DUF3794 domain-containing protein [Oscillospiraceae bacterium]|nr:DUF3794 domain-containing protein [Oscillospiraceae bacterium]
MELELEQTQLSGFNTTLDTTVFQEETMEMIVPDACPDILRIVDTEATVCIREKNAQDGRVEISGNIHAVVLYLPDGEGGLRSLNVKIPFRSMAEAGGIHAECSVVACPQVQAAETRSLNPRKVLVRVNIGVGVRVYRPVSDSLCSGMIADASAGMEQRREEQENFTVVCVQEKPFTFTDEVTLSSSRPEIAELLKSNVSIACGESKVIGNKLIIKGTATVHLFYRTPADLMCSAEQEMVFSQIIEVTECGEDMLCALEVLLSDMDCALLPSGDGRVVSVQLELLAQAVIWEKKRFQMLTDLYSTNHMVNTDSQNYSVQRMVDHGTKTQNVRETIETPTLAQEVCNVSVYISSTEQKREGKQMVLTAQASVKLLYMTEENGLQSAMRQIPVSCALELPDSCLCGFTPRCAGETFAVPTAGGIEVRFGIEFEYMARVVKQVAGVCGVKVEEEEGGCAPKPSIVLRMAERGERLWDIAKCYRTTISDIKSANDLTEDEAMERRLLLIPKKR